jgi:hypothetical protein
MAMVENRVLGTVFEAKMEGSDISLDRIAQ